MKSLQSNKTKFLNVQVQWLTYTLHLTIIRLLVMNEQPAGVNSSTRARVFGDLVMSIRKRELLHKIHRFQFLHLGFMVKNNRTQQVYDARRHSNGIKMMIFPRQITKNIMTARFRAYSQALNVVMYI